MRRALAALVCLLTTACVGQPQGTADTLVATDGLGRTLPTAAECGPPKPGKQVGIFYFLWLGEHAGDGPWDVTKILARDPQAAIDGQSLGGVADPRLGDGLVRAGDTAAAAFSFAFVLRSTPDRWVLRFQRDTVEQIGTTAARSP